MTIIRNKPTATILSNLYNIIRTTFQDEDAYYTSEQIKALKQDKTNIFLNERTK